MKAVPLAGVHPAHGEESDQPFAATVHALLEATRAQGATIVSYDRFKDDRSAIGARISAETGATLAPPYDHPWILAGQGTAALELLELLELKGALVRGAAFIMADSFKMIPSLRFALSG